MNDVVSRPIYYEGQILGPADLLDAIEYARAKRERHDRYLHRWGIVDGLTLTSTGARLFVEPGIAIDGYGREIVVTDRLGLTADDFRRVQGTSADAAALYPVFLTSVFRTREPVPSAMGACAALQASRIQERFQVRFGNLGDETLAEEQEAPGLSAAPSPAEGVSQWLILLGFVSWNDAAGSFASVADFKDVSGNRIGRRYVGVNADSMAAQSGTLVLKTQQRPTPSNPALRLSDDDGGTLSFGFFERPGVFKPVVTVTSDGDIEAKGKLQGRAVTDAVQMESGVATDGMTVPLPPGITPEQLVDGSATVHTLISPHIDPTTPPAPTPAGHVWTGAVQECRVDDDHRLLCRICWTRIDLTASPPPQEVLVLAGSCDYLVLATARRGQGGGP
ncbi:MAG: hypothetical protein U1E38_06150 [Rhodospirillales bacterium]